MAVTQHGYNPAFSIRRLPTFLRLVKLLRITGKAFLSTYDAGIKTEWANIPFPL